VRKLSEFETKENDNTISRLDCLWRSPHFSTIHPENMSPDFPYDLAAVDLDDTLLGPDKRVSSSNRAAVQALREAGLQIVLASGRAVGSMIHIHRELNLDSFMISLNGAVISYPSNDEIIRAQAISAEAGAHLVREGQSHDFTLVACCARRTFASAQTRLLKRYQSSGGERDAIIGFPPDIWSEEVLKLIWIGEPPSLDAIQEQITADSKDLNVIRTESHNLEFMAAGVDKVAGLRLVAEVLRVPRERIIAFGDSANDIKMLGWAGLGIAVGHAVESAKAVARFVGPETDDSASAFAAAVAAVLPVREQKAA
jgi:Cof subfamily protein (haloacid dehalogenase superfamily)